MKVRGTVPVRTIVDCYDPVGNRVTRNFDGNPVTWSYDDLYRLTGQLKPGQVATYTLDGVGNLKTMWEGGSFPRTFTNDLAGKVVTMMEGGNLTTYEWTGYGALATEITGAARTTYSYSGQDQLVGVTDPNGVRSTYSYDGDALRRTAQNGKVLPTTVVWNGSDYLLLRGPTSDQVVLTVEGEILSVGSYDLLPDPLGSVIGYTQAGSNPTTPFSYWPYGRSSSPGFRPPFPFLYVGSLGYYQDSPDRDYVRARELYKSIGRWMQIDPLWPETSAYIDVGASPASYRDPSGLRPPDQWQCMNLPPMPKLPITCSKEWNGYIYFYCNCCRYKVSILPSISSCWDLCDSMAAIYYRACGKPKPRTGPGGIRFLPPPGGGEVAPYPLPKPQTGPCWRAAPDCGPDTTECLNLQVPPSAGGARGLPNTPACRSCCNRIPRTPECGNMWEQCQDACSAGHWLWWQQWMNQFGGPSGRGIR